MDAQNYDGETALIIAGRYGSSGVVQVLLNAGSHVPGH